MNDWYNFVVDADDKRQLLDRLSVMAPHIRLGLKYLSARMVKEYKDAGSPQQKENPDLVGAFYSVQMACLEVQKNDLFMKGSGGSISSFTVALDAAHAIFGRLFPHHKSPIALPRDESPADLIELRVYRGFYENLDRYNRYARAQRLEEHIRIDPLFLTGRVKKLEAEITRLEESLEKGRKLDQLGDDEAEAKPRGKRAREDSAKPAESAKEPVRPEEGRKKGQSTHKRPENVQPEQSEQAKIAFMRTLEFNASESSLMSIHDAKGGSRGAGLTTLKDFEDLLSGGWLSDGVIDPYLALLCEEGNRQPGNDPVPRKFPKWHAWPAWLYLKASDEAELTRLWPPQGYPEAEFGETHHHLFPMHLDGNHWGLAHLSWGGAQWGLDFYSGLPGYVSRFRAQWAGIEKYLKRAWGFKCDQTLAIREPEQARQGNASDCGVFVLCEARCLIEGLPIDTFGQEDMRFMRRRICFELELDRRAS